MGTETGNEERTGCRDGVSGWGSGTRIKGRAWRWRWRWLAREEHLIRIEANAMSVVFDGKIILLELREQLRVVMNPHPFRRLGATNIIHGIFSQRGETNGRP